MRHIFIPIIIVLIVIILGFLGVFLFPKEYDCSDFSTYGEAEKVFKEYTYDKYHLDGNNNGIPCEVLINK